MILQRHHIICDVIKGISVPFFQVLKILENIFQVFLPVVTTLSI